MDICPDTRRWVSGLFYVVIVLRITALYGNGDFYCYFFAKGLGGN